MKCVRLVFHAVVPAVLLCVVSACPNQETFTIRVVNASESIDILAVTISKVGVISGVDQTDNLILRRIRPGRQRDITVALDGVGEGNGIGLLMDGAATSREDKEVPGGFAAGITIVVTVSGNARDTNVDVQV